MTDDDQLTTLRELVRDALEIARSSAVTAHDSDRADLLERTRRTLAASLGELDDFASRDRSG